MSATVPIPTSDGDTAWAAIGYWSRHLSVARLALPDAVWTVSVDGTVLDWDTASGSYGFPG